ncbi:mechanosensitive ion channel family protein [Acinetobacter boissieri]|uniref:Small-conductance mechanosensitive channel n=1 Tax=Acinetobacter boissieri TaxID=1219383 RepID=A0A1G6KA63_9GAMM|nr:mechanosensitive ion channel family protein [Acinetobacter boissieri]SDC27854.1 Small-conductance mechanosensitive channel [Acinetobacter boissieri]
MDKTQIPQDLISSIKALFTSFSLDRVSELFIAALLCIIGFMSARLVSNMFIRTIGLRFNAHQRMVWRRGIFYTIFLFFIIAALKEAGFKVSIFLGAAGILTVALGFASQTSATNLISGLFLIGEGSFEVGDMIQMSLIRGQVIEGEVISIDLLSVKLLTLDNIYIRVPNEQLIRTPVYNMSKYPIRRIPLSVPISFQEDLSKVRKVLISTAFHHPLILDDPKPHMAVTEFAESFIQLNFFVWCHQSHYGQVKDEILERIRDSFIAHDIEIPVPKISFAQDPLADIAPKQ